MHINAVIGVSTRRGTDSTVKKRIDAIIVVGGDNDYDGLRRNRISRRTFSSVQKYCTKRAVLN